MMSMKSLFFAFLMMVFAFPACADEMRENHFLSSLNDIPLMPGMTEVEDEAVVFDKASGRIGESLAIAENLESSEISRFYSLTLPQMGWLETQEGSFVRQDERLRISVAAAQGQNLVRFMVTPR
jgi:hypothetical protein